MLRRSAHKSPVSEGVFNNFYSEYNKINASTIFWKAEDSDDSSIYGDFEGDGDYREDFFDFEIDYNHVNFFDGELPTLRFYKVEKSEFLKAFEDIEEVAMLLE